jgi:hypothetical protein
MASGRSITQSPAANATRVRFQVPPQVTELRAGHQGPGGQFRNPEIPIEHGAEVITGRSLVNDRAICLNAA